MGSARSDFVPQAGVCSGISVSLTARGDLHEWAILVSSPRLPLQFWQLLAIVFFTSTFVLWLGKELSLLSFPFVLYSGLFIMVWVAAPTLALQKATSAWIHHLPCCWKRSCVNIAQILQKQREERMREGRMLEAHCDRPPLHSVKNYRGAYFIKISSK